MSKEKSCLELRFQFGILRPEVLMWILVASPEEIGVSI
jgi:hypothetical protein